MTMDLPDSVKIGAVSYDVVPMDALESMDSDSLGHFHHARQRIAIADFLEPAPTAQVFIHEILHGVWAQWGMQDGSDQETVVTQMALGLSAVLRDNPLLAFALVDALSPDGAPDEDFEDFRGDDGDDGDAA